MSVQKNVLRRSTQVSNNIMLRVFLVNIECFTIPFPQLQTCSFFWDKFHCSPDQAGLDRGLPVSITQVLELKVCTRLLSNCLSRWCPVSFVAYASGAIAKTSWPCARSFMCLLVLASALRWVNFHALRCRYPDTFFCVLITGHWPVQSLHHFYHLLLNL